MTEQQQQEEEIMQPSITIDGVQISVEDLPEEAKAIFGRLQRLIQKEVNAVLDLDEIRAGKVHFESRIVAIVNGPVEEEEGGELTMDIEETDAFPPEED